MTKNKAENMSNYTVRRHGNQYKVYETSTKQYVAIYQNKYDANDICKKLNKGAGFAGTTPRFLCLTQQKKMKKVDINC